MKVTDVDIKSVFNLVDIDKSGTVSRTVSILVQTIEKKTVKLSQPLQSSLIFHPFDLICQF